MPLMHTFLEVLLWKQMSGFIIELLCILSNVLHDGKIVSFSQLESTLVKGMIKLEIQFESARTYVYK